MRSTEFSLKISKRTLICVFILFSYFPASYLHIILPQLASLESVIKLVAIAYGLQYYIRKLSAVKVNSIEKGLIAVIGFVGTLGISSLANGVSMSAYFQFVWLILGGLIVFVVEIRNNENNFIKAITVLFGFYTVINFFTCILFPDGLYSSVTSTGALRTEASYFLGHKNVMIQYMFCGFICMGARNLINRGKLGIKTVIYGALILICNIIGQSTTSIIACIIVAIGIAFYNKKWLSIVFNPISIIVLQLAFFIGIVLLGLQNNFSYFLSDITGKGLDMNGRTEIWAIGLQAFFEHPWLGNGMDTVDNFLNIFSMNNDSFHNLVLDLLFQGGIIGLSLFMFLFVLLNIEIKKITQIKLKNFLNISLFASSIIWISQPVTRTRMMFVYLPVLIVLYFIEKFQSHKNVEEIVR